MLPTKYCFEKYNKKDRWPCSEKRYDGPILPPVNACTGSNHVGYLIGSRYILQQMEAKSQAHGTKNIKQH